MSKKKKEKRNEEKKRKQACKASHVKKYLVNRAVHSQGISIMKIPFSLQKQKKAKKKYEENRSFLKKEGKKEVLKALQIIRTFHF